MVKLKRKKQVLSAAGHHEVFIFPVSSYPRTLHYRVSPSNVRYTPTVLENVFGRQKALLTGRVDKNHRQRPTCRISRGRHCALLNFISDLPIESILTSPDDVDEPAVVRRQPVPIWYRACYLAYTCGAVNVGTFSVGEACHKRAMARIAFAIWGELLDKVLGINHLYRQ